MNVPYASQYITGNTTVQNAAAAGTLLSGFTAGAASQHGEASAVVSASTGKFTCKAGVYEVTFHASIEGPLTSDSATSGDTTGFITHQFAKGGTLVTGTKLGGQDVTDGVRTVISNSAIIEVTAADVVAATNYIQNYLIGGDASGNDILVREARFIIKRLA